MREFAAPFSTAIASPGDVRERLLASTLIDARTIMFGALTAGLCGLVASSLTHSNGPQAVGLLAIAAVPLRVHLIRRRQSHSAADDPKTLRALERSFLFGAAWAHLCAGLLAFVTFRASDDPFLLLLTFANVLVNLFVAASFYFALRNWILLPIAMSITPLGAAMIMKGGLFPLLIPLALAPLCAFIVASAGRLRRIVLDAVAWRSQSQAIAAQFHLAINDMSHGLCTLDDQDRIVVFNEKFRTILSLPREAPLTGCDIGEVLGDFMPQLASSPQFLLGDQFVPHEGASADTTVDVETRDGRTIEMTIHTRSGGGAALVVQDITDRCNAERKIQYMAHFDAVTGLPNRHAFENRLADAMDRWGADRRGLTVLFLDLDNFKQINDTLGHRTGDKVLQEVAERLRALTEGHDFIARWGGDEFVILHAHDAAAPPDLYAYTKRLIEEVSRPLVVDGSQVVVGVSIGSAAAFSDGATAEALLSNADMALYAAKTDGRGRWRKFETEMDTLTQARRVLELELRHAVARDEIGVQFQPIVDATTCRIVAFEALARWRSPTKGNVPPSAFIPVLEETGLIHAFGAAVLRRACAAAVRWPGDVAVSVNLSPIQFREPGLHTTIMEALSASGLGAHRLILEITESTLFDDRVGVSKTLDGLRSRGVRVALDDFGTGYSNFGQLHSYPFDQIKIDRSFTADLGRKQGSSDLVESIAELGRRLRKPVIAEGVETLTQLTAIRRLGIPEAQGYLFGQAVSENEAAALAVGDELRSPFLLSA